MSAWTEEKIKQVNWEMAECVVDYMKSALAEFGVPPSAYADDQLDNFIAMYNRRGNIITELNAENASLRARLSNLEDVLVTVANWPNREKHEQIQAMKIWAASVVDPERVTMLKELLK